MSLLSKHSILKNQRRNLLLFLFLPLGYIAQSQTSFLVKAPPQKRMQIFWEYCDTHFISDQDSAVTLRFLTAVANTADSLGDVRLKRYAQYFWKCYHILFAQRYEQYFRQGDYQSAAAALEKVKAWAQKEGYADIVASCEHYTGQIYFRANRYGSAFEHLLKAHEAFQKIGYENVPNASGYLYNLGLAYYRFEEWDKALETFLAAMHYPFYVSRDEINTYNAIGLIYSRQKEWDKAALFYHQTIAIAITNNNTTWIGIASGNLGNVFLQRGQNDSALFYHRINYFINSSAGSRAPEDAALTSLAIAAAFVRQSQTDSALYYIKSAKRLARESAEDVTGILEFRKRLLTVLIELNKKTNNYRTVSLLSDSLTTVKDSLKQILDAKILSRAVEKAETDRYAAELKLMETQKNLNRLRFYIVIAALLLIIVIGSLLFNRFRMRKQRQAELDDKEKKLLSMEKKSAEENLKHAEELLSAYLTTITEKTALIENLDAEMQRLKESAYPVNSLEGIAINMERLISSTILTDNDWRRFRNLFEQAHPGFLYRLKEKYADLSPAEIRLLILTKLKLPSREMARMLGITIEAIRKSRYRVRKKLNLNEESNLESLIQQI